MQIGVIGMNHKSATIPLREAFAKATERRFGAELPLHGSLSYVLLSTCNRTELYFCADNLAEAHVYLLDILRKEMTKPFEHTLYSYFGFDCFFHLAEVTSGIDSAVIGETEIQGQVKNAYEKARCFLRKELHFLFQKSLKIGKKIRTCFRYQKRPTLEQSVSDSAAYILGDLEKHCILFVGVSDINKKLINYFRLQQYNNITLCNRTCNKAKTLAHQKNLKHLSWHLLPKWNNYDLIIVGTKAKDYLITQTPPPQKKPKLIVDLSVPRNVDPLIGINLLNVDHLSPRSTPHATYLQKQMIKKAAQTQITLFSSRYQKVALSHIA